MGSGGGAAEDGRRKGGMKGTKMTRDEELQRNEGTRGTTKYWARAAEKGGRASAGERAMTAGRDGGEREQERRR